MRTGLTKAGEYNIKTLQITAHNNFSMNITEVFRTVTVYEDIYSNSITMSVDIVTTEDLISTLPIIGQETISIEANHPSDERIPIKLDFIVYSITKHRKTGNEVTFTLNCVTPEQVRNYETRISKYFEGTSTDISQKIFNELGSNKTLLKVGSDDKQKLIVPNMTPMRALNWLTEKAFKGAAADYLFFEAIDGYHLQPLSELVTKEEQITFSARLPNAELDPDFEDKTIIEWTIVNNFDVIDNMMRGMYNSTALKVDILNRKSEKIEYSIYDKYMETNKLDKYPLFDISGQGRKYMPDPLYLLPENSEITYNHDENFLQRKSQLQLLHNLKIQLTTFGDTQVNVGKTIKLEIPDLIVPEDTTLNERYSGKWLVTAVKHIFTHKTVYTNEIECVRDSQGEILPQANPDYSGSAFKSGPQ